jgi:hypothetical protein
VVVMDQDGRPLDPALSTAVLEPSLREASWPAALPADAEAVVVLMGTSAGQDVPALAAVPHGAQRVAVLFGAGPLGGALRDAACRLEAEGWHVAEADA